MKQLLTVLCLTITCMNVFSQNVYLTMGATTKTATVGIGFLSEDNYQLSLSGDLPFSSTDKPRFFSINGGKQFDVGEYLLTPTVGGAYLKYTNLTEYDKGGLMIQVEKAAPVFGLEFGKDIHMGRISLTSKYCLGMYYGLSIRGFFGDRY